METAVYKPSQKYLNAFIATFLPQNIGAKLYRTELKVITSTLNAVLNCKFHYEIDAADVYLSLKMLRYNCYNEPTFLPFDQSASMPGPEVSTSAICFNIEGKKVEELRFLAHTLCAKQPVKKTLRIDELNLQLDMFDKLYKLKSAPPYIYGR